MESERDTEPTSVPPAPPRAASRGAGFLGRLVAALLVVIMTTALTLFVVFFSFIWLGFSVETPGQIAESRMLLATAQADSTALRLQNEVLQTRVADLDGRVTDGRDTLDTLRGQVVELEAVRNRLAESESQNATVIAEARAVQNDVVLFATAEAGRASTINALERRAERIERFLQRLSDISNDAALDLQALPTSSVTPIGADEPTETAEQAPNVTPTPTATSTP